MHGRRLQSSVIDRIVFDDDAETLSIWFRQSGRYIYEGVPRAIYDALARAPSAGRFFQEAIRGRFPCRRDPARRRYPLTD